MTSLATAQHFFLQVYGFQSIILLNNMEKTGIIKLQKPNYKVYPTVRKNLNLLVEDINEQVSLYNG